MLGTKIRVMGIASAWRGLCATSVAVLTFLVGVPDAHALGPNAIRPGFDFNEVARNDDESTDLVALGFPVNFFGATYSEAYVNNNGNVTFDAPLGTYTPFDLNSTSRAIIAPFFADVDTRVSGEPVRYGTGTADGHAAFGVSWEDVDCYQSNTSRPVRNYFQLVLIDRSDIEPAAFDIEFNYDQIQWETGEASGGSALCLGGSAARVGYANGFGASFELPGSGVSGAFLDANTVTGLVHNSVGSAQLGRYVFNVRGGTPPGGSIAGTIRSALAPVPGAWVQACASGFCRASQADGDGLYAVTGLAPGDYMMRALPPAGSVLNPASAGPITIVGDDAVLGVDLVLTGPLPPPEGTTIEPSTTGPSGLPSVYWGDVLALRTEGCAGAVASYEVTMEDGSVLVAGAMIEAPAGTYTATVGPFYPTSGNVHVAIALDCPGDIDEEVDFDLYIDPSGIVRTTSGAPLTDAVVTLYRADDSTGEFVLVPDGSAVMSPSNRSNPDVTDGSGRFGWDVIAGFYVVRVEAPGCVSPADPSQTYVETPVLSIPPPVTDLVLELDCENETTPRTSIQTAHATLAGALPTGDDQSDKRIGVAIERLEAALLPERWMDDETLPAALGKYVFSDARKAAKQLQKITAAAALGSEEAAAALQLLGAAGRRLAELWIELVSLVGGNPDDIAKARNQFEKGESWLAIGAVDKAIGAYGKAWRYTMRAIS